VIVAGRPELLARRPHWGELRSATPIDVTPLDRRSSARLVRMLLEDAEVPAGTIETLIDRAEGIPLFAEEFTRLIRERGAGAGTTPVPQSLRLLVAARLDQLSHEERAVLQDASVVGRTFWTGAVAAVAGEDPGRLDAVLASLTDRELLRRVVPSTVHGEEEFTFWHAVVRDVAYAQIPRATRASKHRDVARWIEATAGDRVDDRVELLAYHFGRAHGLSLDSGDRDEADAILEPTTRYLHLAAERASGLDPERAMGLAERALALTPPEHPDRPRILTGAGRTAASLGRHAEAERHLIEALHAYQVLDDQVGRADVMIALARSRLEQGEMEDVETLTAVALGLLEAESPGPELARAYARHAGLLLVNGDYDGCLRQAMRGLSLARRLGLAREEVLALNYAGSARGLLGDPGGLDDLREAIERGIAVGAGSETAIAMNNLATDLRYLEGPAASIETWERMEAFCEEHGLVTAGAWARSGMAEALFDAGEWDEVLAVVAELERWEHDHGMSVVGTTALTLAGWVALRRGDVESAAARLETLLERAGRAAVAEYAAPAHALAAEVAMARGDPDEARRHLESFGRIAESDRVFAAAVLPIVARLFVRLGDPGAARALLEGLPELRSPRERLSAETVRALLDGAEGRHADAVARLMPLVDAWRGYGFPLEVGLTGTALARSLVALGRRDEARAAAADAARVLRGLDAEPLARAAGRAADP
jgi:tetratricopeptide (TPR) repeat protein